MAKPTVFIPVFPGTNCEYDSAKAFERAGADTIVKVFKNLNAADIRDSVDEICKSNRAVTDYHVPGLDSPQEMKPEGSAKFFCNGIP